VLNVLLLLGLVLGGIDTAQTWHYTGQGYVEQNPLWRTASPAAMVVKTGIDVGIRTTVTRRREDLEHEIFSSIEDRVVNEVLPKMQSFEEVSAEVGQAEVAVHKSYVRRELHPIVLCSPFLYRTYTKPLGYAGDYEMMNMIHRQTTDGQTAYAKIVNTAYVRMALT
jgi:hypothetical protein